MCYRRFAYTAFRREHSHTETVFRVTPYIAFYASLILSGISPYQGIVSTGSGFIEELQPKTRLGFGGLGYHKQSAGIFINAVYQSHFRIINIKVRIVFQMPSHGIDQSAIEITAPRMHHHASRLVDNHQAVVFIHHIQGDIFCFYSGIERRMVQPYGHNVQRFDPITTFHRPVIDLYETSLCRLLDSVAGSILQMQEQKLVHTKQ